MQKGGSAPVHWWIPRRADHRDRRIGGRAGHSHGHSPASGTDPPRQGRSATEQQGAFWRSATETDDATAVTEAAGESRTDTYTVVLKAQPSAGVEVAVGEQNI